MSQASYLATTVCGKTFKQKIFTVFMFFTHHKYFPTDNLPVLIFNNMCIYIHMYMQIIINSIYIRIQQINILQMKLGQSGYLF